MLYEDDFEFEEQPADLRDRTIGGRPGGGRGAGGRGGGTRRREPRRTPSGESAHQPLPDDAKPAHDLLREILEGMGVGPVDIHYIARPEGEYLEVSGPHLGMLIGRHGNTLEALNLLFNNSFNAGVRTNRRYYTIDAEGYRAHRADQLKHLALATVERVVRDRQPQKLEPMLPSERKIVHLALANSETVRTESEGEEPERRVVIFPR
ncbi:MAG TPA: R3H domain-containing nucleic acid-binding protein [Candidatus Dormibacteraeota bacterium]|jgi:spoIIIJ-associated protein|nr:R3H domain-containing nucleic acid-binding protein [Candidatus Dormibacteraeota bacterium]